LPPHRGELRGTNDICAEVGAAGFNRPLIDKKLKNSG
jgi:hypothetical protein